MLGSARRKTPGLRRAGQQQPFPRVKLLVYTNRPNLSEASQAIAIAIQLVRVANRLLIAQLSTATVNYRGAIGPLPRVPTFGLTV